MAAVKRVRKGVVRVSQVSSISTPCLVGACSPQRTQGLLAYPVARGTHKLIDLMGPGLFLSAEVVKQGGTNGLTFVDLTIDGKNVVSISYDAARNTGLGRSSPYGVQILDGAGLENLVIGWPFPLTFRRSLVLSVIVRQDNVVQILANVMHARTV